MSRIFALAIVYCIVFFVLVLTQFSNKGSFSLSVGEMTIRGRYLQDSSASHLAADELSIPAFLTIDDESIIHEITGGARIFYGGLEFILSEERGKGLTLSGTGGINPVNPGYLVLTDNAARFGLPGGTVIVFNSFESARGMELQISAEFTEDFSQITIPITSRRSSLVHDSGQLGIMYGGLRYSFAGQGEELETGRIVLSRDRTFISYQSRRRQDEFDPANYIIAQSQNYESSLAALRNSNFTRWNQNVSILQNEDDIIPYLAEAITRGNYTTAVNAIPQDFINSARHSHRSAVYVGGMANAYRTFVNNENEKLSLITRLVRERSPDILKEEHILDYLFARNNITLANEVINIINNVSTEMITADYCPGLLEVHSDIRRWRPAMNNPVDNLSQQILAVISENLIRDTERDIVLASNSEGINLDYSIRLGKALASWAGVTQDTEWRAIGQSLVLSVLTEAGTNAGRYFNILKAGDYYPRAALLTDTGFWAWTITPSARASLIDGNLNITVSFPPTMSHHMIIRGVRPFIKLQIHGMDWRTDSQFERYDSSGWVYYPQDQILVVKLRHRTTTETVTIFYRVDEPETETDGEAAAS